MISFLSQKKSFFKNEVYLSNWKYNVFRTVIHLINTFVVDLQFVALSNKFIYKTI